jgi:hypothetical protein
MLPTWFSMVNWCYVWPRIDLDFSLWLGILTLSNREIFSRRRKRIYIYILLVEKILVCFYWLDLVAHRILVIVTCHDCCDMYIIKVNQVILSHIYIYYWWRKVICSSLDTLFSCFTPCITFYSPHNNSTIFANLSIKEYLIQPKNLFYKIFHNSITTCKKHFIHNRRHDRRIGPKWSSVRFINTSNHCLQPNISCGSAVGLVIPTYQGHAFSYLTS